MTLQEAKCLSVGSRIGIKKTGRELDILSIGQQGKTLLFACNDGATYMHTELCNPSRYIDLSKNISQDYRRHVMHRVATTETSLNKNGTWYVFADGSMTYILDPDERQQHNMETDSRKLVLSFLA